MLLLHTSTGVHNNNNNCNNKTIIIKAADLNYLGVNMHMNHHGELRWVRVNIALSSTYLLVRCLTLNSKTIPLDLRH